MPKIRYSFIKMGAAVQPEPGKLFLDTGNDLCPGILDHHHLSRETCAALLALERKDLYTDWLAGYAEVEVVLHEEPDTDCVAALFIVDAVLNKSRIREDLLLKLARYTLDRDMGKTEKPDIERPSLYDILMARHQIIRDEYACREGSPGTNDADGEICRKMYERLTEAGLEIISRFLNMIQDEEILDFRLDSSMVEENLFRDERNYLKDDLARYLSDLSDFNRVTIIKTRLPLKDINTSEEKKALIYRDPSSSLFKLWARHDTFHAGSREGFTTLLVIRSQKDQRIKRYIISTDPLEKYCLRFLGDVLNYHEQRKRGILGMPQRGKNRPGYDLPDPWYDGRAHNFTIVDTPHDGTVLDEEEIISIFSYFVTENIFLNIRVMESSSMVIFPQRIRNTEQETLARIFAAGFEPIKQDEPLKQTFTSSFIGLFFSHDTPIKLFVKRALEHRTIIIPMGMMEDHVPVLIEAYFLLSYSNILLYAVQLKVEDERLGTVQEFNRFLNSRDLTRKYTPEDERQWGFLLDPMQDLGMDTELFMNRVFLFNSILLKNFHLFREPDLTLPIIHAFLSCDDTSIPSRPMANEIITYSDYYTIGMNSNRYLSFQNLYDPQLNRKNILDIFSLDQKHYSYLYLFIILKKVVLRDLSERFSRLNVMKTTRRTAKEYRMLEADALSYINTINQRYITSDCIAMQICAKMHEVNTISESFSEIYTSMMQLNEYHDARMQKKQSIQMDILQAIFLVGVVAAVMSLGAMPGAKIVTSITHDAAGKIVWDSALTAFDLFDLIKWGLPALLSGVGIWLLIKLIFFLKKTE